MIALRKFFPALVALAPLTAGAQSLVPIDPETPSGPQFTRPPAGGTTIIPDFGTPLALPPSDFAIETNAAEVVPGLAGELPVPAPAPVPLTPLAPLPAVEPASAPSSESVVAPELPPAIATAAAGEGFVPAAEPVEIAPLAVAVSAPAAAGGLLPPAPDAAPLPLRKPAPPSPTLPVGADLALDFGLSGQVGYIVIDLDTGQVLDAMAPDRAFVPASVAKLPTALFALEVLGADWRFETRILTKGSVVGGVLSGDLYILGGGDPELDTDALMGLVTRLSGAGVRRVQGGLFVDGSRAVEIAAIDASQPVEAPYNPALSGLSLNFNRIWMTWTPRRGKTPSIRVEARAADLSPVVSGFRIDLTGAGAPRFAHLTSGSEEVWRVRAGTLGKRAGSRWLPVRMPDLYAGRVFRELARGFGLALSAPQRGRAPTDGRLLARHLSRPLGEIITAMLKHSTNLTAEMVGIAAARRLGAAPRSPADSAAVLNDWAAQFAGFARGDAGFRLANHSGLSLVSRLSPRRMTDLLAAAARRPQLVAFREPAMTGAIAGFLKPHNVSDKGAPAPVGLVVRAKTGTMNYVRGLAGYITTPGGRRLAFAYFANDIGARGSGNSSRWLARARALERALIRNWAARFDRR